MDSDIWLPVLLAAIGGGSMVALIHAVSDPLRMRLAHRLQLAEKRDNARFDDQRRRLAAHLEAAGDYLGDLDGLLRWANSIAAETLWGDTDYFDPEGSVRSPLNALPGHLSNLRRLFVNHPTRMVRTQARDLDGSLRGFYGDMTRQDGVNHFPSASDRDTLLHFIKRIEALIEAVHDPEREAGDLT